QASARSRRPQRAARTAATDEAPAAASDVDGTQHDRLHEVHAGVNVGLAKGICKGDEHSAYDVCREARSALHTRSDHPRMTEVRINRDNSVTRSALWRPRDAILYMASSLRPRSPGAQASP